MSSNTVVTKAGQQLIDDTTLEAARQHKLEQDLKYSYVHDLTPSEAALWHNWTLRQLAAIKTQIPRMIQYFPEISDELNKLAPLLDECLVKGNKLNPRKEPYRLRKKKPDTS